MNYKVIIVHHQVKLEFARIGQTQQKNSDHHQDRRRKEGLNSISSQYLVTSLYDLHAYFGPP